MKDKLCDIKSLASVLCAPGKSEQNIILTQMEAAIIKEQYDKGLPMFIFRSGETIKFERN